MTSLPVLDLVFYYRVLKPALSPDLSSCCCHLFSLFSIHFTSSGDNCDWALSGIGFSGGFGSLHLKRDKAGDVRGAFHPFIPESTSHLRPVTLHYQRATPNVAPQMWTKYESPFLCTSLFPPLAGGDKQHRGIGRELGSPSPHKKNTLSVSASLPLFLHPILYPYPAQRFFFPPFQLCLQAFPWQLSHCLPSNRLYPFTGKKGKKKVGGTGHGVGDEGVVGIFFLWMHGMWVRKGSVTAACCSRFIKSDSLLSLTSTPAARASPLPCYHSISPQACPIYSQPVYTCKNVALIIIFLGEKNCSHKWVFMFLNSWGVANRSSNYSMNHFSPFEKVSKDKM